MDVIRLDHLERLLGPHGLFEHAEFRQPRPEHGYCTDDNARALVVLAGLDSPDAERIFHRCLRFVVRGFTPSGWRNRMSHEGRWLDGVGPEDSHGRVVWGLGVAARHGRLPADLLPLFDAACHRRLRSPRSAAYALLGAAAALGTPADASARRALALHFPVLPAVRPGGWRWPEERLTYDNARLPLAMIEAGSAVEDRLVRNAGLHLLEWLVGVESGPHGFSYTPVSGRGPGERGPAFDQQPIEAWAMAEACETAARVTGEAVWLARAVTAADWFHGRNDVGASVYDSLTGAGHDGLEEAGVNLNCGAESTLSALGAESVRSRIPRGEATMAAS